MSRHLSANARGRQPQVGSTRGPRAKLDLEKKYQHKKKARTGAKSTTYVVKGRSRVKPASRTSDVESTASSSSFDSEVGEDGAEYDNNGEDVDDEDEEGETEPEPEVFAPSRPSRSRGGPGRYQYDQFDDNLSDAGDWNGVAIIDFEANDDDDNNDLQRDEELEKRLFDSDNDDQIYEAVNEVSDSDDDPQALERAETELLLDEFDQLDQLDGEAARLINEIDGLSACGFGEESDESMHFPLSPHGSDDAAEIARRRVRFEENIAYQQAAMTSLSDSPTMTRALLPSALPETFMGLNDETQDNIGSDDPVDDGYDTDATDQLPIPSQAFQVSPRGARAIDHEGSPSMLEPSQRTPGDKPPTKGRFEDDGSKVTAILDPTGRKLLLSDPQGVFARRCGPSVPASPSVGFEEAVFGESDSSQASMSPRLPQTQDFSGAEPVDLMLSGLNSGIHTSPNGQATGLPEAFLAPAIHNQDNDMSNSASLAADFLRFPTEEPDEMELNLEDMITFGNETDDEDTTARNIFMPDDLEFLGSDTGLTHLNNMNVTAFRRNADPTFAAQASQSGRAIRYNQFTTPRINRKRKADNDSPYNHNHYKGVTPVQRITENSVPSSPVPMPSKRRRVMTIA